VAFRHSRLRPAPQVWGEPDAIVEGRVFEPPKSEAAMVAANPFDGVALPPEVNARCALAAACCECCDRC
jgi:hypothetical protein